MLRVARLTDRSGRYYLSDLTSDLSQELDVGPVGGGRWAGSGAAALGLRGPAGAEDLGAVLSGCHPVTGRPLRRHGTRVCGYDLTFAAPKSVSVLLGLGGGDVARTVAAAHSTAVAQALDYVSAHALAARRGPREERYLVGTEGAIGASFAHGLSRTLDPHLHTHVVVANLAHGVDGRWTAIDGRGLWAHARAAGALYDAHLRHELGSRLGLAWSPRRNGAYELCAIDPVVIGALSGRHAEIAGHLADHAAPGTPSSGRPGPGRWHSGPSARARAVAWAATRAEKPVAVTVAELRQQWLSRASDAGYEPGALARGISPEAGAYRHRSELRVLDEHRFAASLVTTASEAPTRR
ncbi:MAG: MobF family relaxase, partial [Solirubrobacteraceae bacterium]